MGHRTDFMQTAHIYIYIYGLIAKKRVPPNILYVQFSFEHHVKTNEDTEVGFAPRLRELNGLSFDI